MSSLTNQLTKCSRPKNSKHIRFHGVPSFSPSLLSNPYLNQLDLCTPDLCVNCSSNLEINNIVHLDTVFDSKISNYYNIPLWNNHFALDLNENLKQYAITSKLVNLNYPFNDNGV
ncbi:unnamed protein product [Schistosoma turkestanicum]|nr:unnamed protein product [Schistosoma turkestanicum]